MLTNTYMRPIACLRRAAPLGLRVVAGAAVVGSSLLGSMVDGQVPNAAIRHPALADSSVPALMKLARRGTFPDEAAVEILRQGTRAYPEGKRLALADSIAELAINLRGSAVSAVGTIKRWGVADPHRSGQADPNALNYLIRISREARDADTRMGAIRGMVVQVNPARALPYLTEVAASARPKDALAAVDELIRLGFGGSIGTPDDRASAAKALRQLYDAGAMKSDGAISTLCQTAAWQRWPAKPMCRGGA